MIAFEYDAALPPPAEDEPLPRFHERVDRPEHDAADAADAHDGLCDPFAAFAPFDDMRATIVMRGGADARRRLGPGNAPRGVASSPGSGPTTAPAVVAVPAADRVEPPPRRDPVTTEARIVSLSAPTYPDDARGSGAQGVVRLVVEVLEDGTAGEIVIEVTSGWRSLDDAAVAAVRRWRFAPATIDGTPCRARVHVPAIRFRLGR